MINPDERPESEPGARAYDTPEGDLPPAPTGRLPLNGIRMSYYIDQAVRGTITLVDPPVTPDELDDPVRRDGEPLG